MQLTNCRQVTQIIHTEDDDDDGKEAQAGEDAMGMKWDGMGWDGVEWKGMGDHSRTVSIAWIILFFLPIFLLLTSVTATVKRARHVVKESVKYTRSWYHFRQKSS